MHKIHVAGERTSDKIIRQFTAELLNIPETEEEARRISAMCASCKHDKVAAECDCGEPGCECNEKKAKCANACPQCGNQMQKSGNMERCVCGYATATREVVEEMKRAASRKKKAVDTGVAEYYKKIFPDDYVADLTSDSPKTPDAGKSVQYGNVDPNKKVSVREILANDYPECGVEDNHPESGVGSGSGATETPDPKWQKGESANSVSGPEKANSHGPGSGGDFPNVSAPDLGVGKHKRSRRLLTAEHPAGSPTKLEDPSPQSGVNSGSAQENPEPKMQCGDSANSVSGPEKVNSHGPGSGGDFPDAPAPDLGLPAQAGNTYISREVLGEFSPQLAVKMQALGIKGLSARFIARTLSEAIEKTSNMQKRAVSPPGMKGLTEHMKQHKEIDNPFALSWWMKNKGYQPRKKRYPTHE